MWPLSLLSKKKVNKSLQAADNSNWWNIFDWKIGTWQQNRPNDKDDTPYAYPTVFSCQTLIASDIAKQKVIVQVQDNRIWKKVPSNISELLKRPNGYQHSIQFLEMWILSKLGFGNTYVLKVRDGRDVVQLHVLDPLKVTPLISDSGEVFYRIDQNRLAKVEEEQIILPASEIIHDRFNCLFSPLIGVSPLFAAAHAATTGLNTQENLKYFFANNSNPGGILTAPGAISDSTATRLKEYWNNNFKGKNSGQIAVIGDNLTYNQMRMSNVDAQVIELMNWNDEKICSVYHVPGYMVGVGGQPKFDNIEALTQAYYSQCLQILIESIEAGLDLGLSIQNNHRVQLDVDSGLFRMDRATQVKTLGEGIKNALYAPNEGRENLNLPPLTGGDQAYLQQQNYSLEALARRDGQTSQQQQNAANTQQALEMFDTLTKSIKLH